MASEDRGTLREDGDSAVPKYADRAIVMLHTGIDSVDYGKAIPAYVSVRQGDNVVHPMTTKLFPVIAILVNITLLSKARRLSGE